jgi:hypothetical protein
MQISQVLLPEFDTEMAKTRTTLERVPDDKLGWKPHEKSMTMGRLAGHLAELTTWVGDTIGKDSFDVAPPGGPQFVAYTAKSNKETLDFLRQEPR